MLFCYNINALSITLPMFYVMSIYLILRKFCKSANVLLFKNSLLRKEGWKILL